MLKKTNCFKGKCHVHVICRNELCHQYEYIYICIYIYTLYIHIIYMCVYIYFFFFCLYIVVESFWTRMSKNTHIRAESFFAIFKSVDTCPIEDGAILQSIVWHVLTVH